MLQILLVLLMLVAILGVPVVLFRSRIMWLSMTALAADRDTPTRDSKIFSYPMAAAVKGYAGGLAVLDASGNVKPAVTATGLICVGRFRDQYDNSAGAAADISAEVEQGTFRWANSSAGDAITKAEIGDVCYIVDDQTVAKTDATGTRSAAGYIVDVDSDGVWVKTEYRGQ
jgi:hypothetical protein